MSSDGYLKYSSRSPVFCYTCRALWKTQSTPPSKTNECSLNRYYFNIGNASSNYSCSGDMLVFRGGPVDIFKSHLTVWILVTAGPSVWMKRGSNLKHQRVALPETNSEFIYPEHGWLEGLYTESIFVSGRVRWISETFKEAKGFNLHHVFSPIVNIPVLWICHGIFSVNTFQPLFESGILEFCRGLLVGGFCGSNESFRSAHTTTISMATFSSAEMWRNSNSI